MKKPDYHNDPNLNITAIECLVSVPWGDGGLLEKFGDTRFIEAFNKISRTCSVLKIGPSVGWHDSHRQLSISISPTVVPNSLAMLRYSIREAEESIPGTLSRLRALLCERGALEILLAEDGGDGKKEGGGKDEEAGADSTG